LILVHEYKTHSKKASKKEKIGNIIKPLPTGRTLQNNLPSKAGDSPEERKEKKTKNNAKNSTEIV
jgi:hypothetical protein